MVNFMPLTFTTRLTTPTAVAEHQTAGLYLGARNFESSSSSIVDDPMDVDDTPMTMTPSPNSQMNSSRQPPHSQQSYYLMETDTDDFDEAVPATDEIYHAVVRLVDANEAVNNGHFVQIDTSPSIVDDDEEEDEDDEDDDEMIGDVLLSSSDSDTDSTASWKSVRSGNSEDNENRSHGKQHLGRVSRGKLKN